jgi:hypothetical protein
MQPLTLVLDGSAVSGELYFRLQEQNGNCGRNYQTDMSDEFWNFLGVEHQNSMKKFIHFRQLNSQHFKKCFALKNMHDIYLLNWSIESIKEKICTQFELNTIQFDKNLNNLVNDFDSIMLILVMEYYSVLEKEVLSTRNRLTNEAIEKEIKIKQAIALNNIRTFLCHLNVETNNKILITSLPKESPQFLRCVKAIIENLNPVYFVFDDGNNFEYCKKKIKILNVFKSQNQFLSTNLQVFL